MRSLLWIILLTAAASSAPSEVVVTEKDRFNTIKVPIGSQLVIRLDPVHHTDIIKRVWNYVPGRIDKEHLKLESVERTPSLEVFRYRPLARGKKTLLGLDYCVKKGDSYDRPPLKEFLIEVETP